MKELEITQENERNQHENIINTFIHKRVTLTNCPVYLHLYHKSSETVDTKLTAPFALAHSAAYLNINGISPLPSCFSLIRVPFTLQFSPPSMIDSVVNPT